MSPTNSFLSITLAVLFDESQKRDGFAYWYKRTRILEKDFTIGKDGSMYRKNK